MQQFTTLAFKIIWLELLNWGYLKCNLRKHSGVTLLIRRYPNTIRPRIADLKPFN